MSKWKYYVYTLSDPRDGRAFYVGKGSGDRIDAHEREARKGIKSPKCDRIREIKSAGLAIQKTRIAHFEKEAEAYAFESLLIKEQQQTLTNGGQVVLIDEFNFRFLATAIKAKAGVYKDARFAGRPFAMALRDALIGRADEIIKKYMKRFSIQELNARLAMHRVTLITG